MPSKPLTTWVEIDSSSLISNIKSLHSLVNPEIIFAPTVKANAYGHDIKLVSRIFARAGADWLCVHSLDEAFLVRSAAPKIPILIFGYVTIDRLNELVVSQFKILLYDMNRAIVLQNLAKQENVIIDVHIKIETGINRQGLEASEALELASFVSKASHLKLEGLSSHFANIEDTTDPSYAWRQISKFEDAISLLENNDINIPIKHIANSAATILYPETHFEMVRPGIATYGMWPAQITKLAAQKDRADLLLTPAITWKAKIAQTKAIAKDSSVGYGCTFIAAKDMRIAIIPIGYYEGYPRSVTKDAYVLVHGQKCPIIGRICMNNLMIDITSVPLIAPEDEVVLLGRQSDQSITAEDIAEWSGRINYEITTGINSSIPRIEIAI